MTAGEYLGQAKTLQREIDTLRTFLEHARGTQTRDKVASEIGRLEALQYEIYEKIQAVPDPHYRDILIDHYMSGLTNESIAERTSYSVSQIKRHKKVAVKMFAEIHNFVKDDPK